jgi:hypothetical protein
MNLTPIGRLLKEIDASDILDFEPTDKMEMAKERFWKALNSNPMLTNDIGNMTLDALIMHSRSKHLTKWIEKHPLFLAWFCDEEFEQLTIQTMAKEAYKKVREIMHSPLEPKVLTAKDQLNAANMLLQLGDKFPNKRREIIYADKELAKMTDSDVDKEMRSIESQLKRQALPADSLERRQVDNDE